MTIFKGLDMAPSAKPSSEPLAEIRTRPFVRPRSAGSWSFPDAEGTALASLRKSAAEGSRAALFELAHAKDKGASGGSRSRNDGARRGSSTRAARASSRPVRWIVPPTCSQIPTLTFA